MTPGQPVLSNERKSTGGQGLALGQTEANIWFVTGWPSKKTMVQPLVYSFLAVKTIFSKMILFLIEGSSAHQNDLPWQSFDAP